MKKRKVAIGIQIGGMTEAEMEMLEAAMKEKMGETGGMGGGRSGGSMGGMGGMGGSRGGGAMGSRGGDTRSRMNPEIEWLSVTLPPNE